MANQFLAAQEYANVMLLLLKNQLVTGRLVDGQFKDQVTDENGLIMNIKRPPRFVAQNGSQLVPQDILTGSVAVAVNQYKNVHISIGDLEYVQSYNALMQNETMKSSATTLANAVDSFLQGQTLGFASWVAGAGSATDPGVGVNMVTPHDFSNQTQAMAVETRLAEHGVPITDVCATISFRDAQLITGSMQSAFTPDLNTAALEKARVPIISNVDFYKTQQNPVLTTGSRPTGDGSSTGVQVNNANQNVNYRDVRGAAGTPGYVQNLILKGAGDAGTISAGEVFTIEGVYQWDWRVNGSLGAALPDLAQFTVVSAVTASSGGAVTVSITPPIIVQGTADETGSTIPNTAFATVDSIPGANAYVKFVGAASTAYRVKSAWHKRAIAMVTARLAMPFTGVASFAVDPDTGIAVRYWRGSDIVSGQHIHRWDMVYGAAVMDPFLGTRIGGS